MRLASDYKTTVFECQHRSMRKTITVPAGTLLTRVENGQDTLYAVSDVRLIVALTGNNFDPYRHYVFVPTDQVKE